MFPNFRQKSNYNNRKFQLAQTTLVILINEQIKLIIKEKKYIFLLSFIENYLDNF
jgi:hypothetical protein